jgi:hypothetical protein
LTKGDYHGLESFHAFSLESREGISEELPVLRKKHWLIVTIAAALCRKTQISALRVEYELT